MTDLIKTGRSRTIIISISTLLVSIYTIYLYHAVRPDVDTTKLTQQVVRFLLTVGLLIGVYKGKKWAKILALVLFSITGIASLVTILNPDISVIIKIPFMVMCFVYSLAVFHFGFSESFKAFYDYQNDRQLDSETNQ